MKAEEVVMTVRLEIKPEIEASLNAQAAAKGIPLGVPFPADTNVLLRLAEPSLRPAPPSTHGRGPFSDSPLLTSRKGLIME
jgi:hypothetical protein